jgi:hypothetical protein
MPLTNNKDALNLNSSFAAFFINDSPDQISDQHVIATYIVIRNFGMYCTLHLLNGKYGLLRTRLHSVRKACVPI